MNDKHCRICEINEALEDANDFETVYDTLMVETLEPTMDLLIEDDVYQYLMDKYRDLAIRNMPEEEYQQLLFKLKGKTPLKLVVDKEHDSALN